MGSSLRHRVSDPQELRLEMSRSTKRNAVNGSIWYATQGARRNAPVDLRIDGSLFEFESLAWGYLAHLNPHTPVETIYHKGRPWRYLLKSTLKSASATETLVPLRHEADWIAMMCQMTDAESGSYSLILTQEDWSATFEKAYTLAHSLKMGARVLDDRLLQQTMNKDIDSLAMYDELTKDFDETGPGIFHSHDDAALDEIATATNAVAAANLGNEEIVSEQLQPTDAVALDELATERHSAQIVHTSRTNLSPAHNAQSQGANKQPTLMFIVKTARASTTESKDEAHKSRTHSDQERYNRNSHAQNGKAGVAKNTRRVRRAETRTSENHDQGQDRSRTGARRSTARRGPKMVSPASGNLATRDGGHQISTLSKDKSPQGRTLRSGKGYGAIKMPASSRKVRGVAS